MRRDKDDSTERDTGARITREVVPSERFLVVLEGGLIEGFVLFVRYRLRIADERYMMS